MKVLLVSAYPPAKDGIADYTERFVASLKSKSNDVCVIAPKSADAKSTKDVCRILDNNLEDINATLAKIMAFQPDVIHVQYCIALYGFNSYAIWRLMRSVKQAMPYTPRIITLHEIRREQNKLKFAAKLFYRFYLTRFDGFIVHTHGAEQILRRSYRIPAKRIARINFPVVQSSSTTVNSNLQSINAKYHLANKFVVLCFGFIQVDKGIDILVRAVPEIKQDPRFKSKLRVVIAGDIRNRKGIFKYFEWKDRKYLHRILRFVAKEDIGKEIEFTGYVSSQDISDLFSRADAIAIPYTDIEQSSVLGMSLTAGKPIIATNVGGIGETLKSAGILVPPGDHVKLAAAIKRSYNFSGKSALLQKYALLAKSASQEAATTQTIRFYEYGKLS